MSSPAPNVKPALLPATSSTEAIGAMQVTQAFTAEGATRTRWQWTVDPGTSLRRFWRLRAARP